MCNMDGSSCFMISSLLFLNEELTFKNEWRRWRLQNEDHITRRYLEGSNRWISPRKLRDVDMYIVSLGNDIVTTMGYLELTSEIGKKNIYIYIHTYIIIHLYYHHIFCTVHWWVWSISEPPKAFLPLLKSSLVRKGHSMSIWSSTWDKDLKSVLKSDGMDENACKYHG